ncbi:MAG: hypothetical protein ABSH14_09360 [Verrucomicrobiia bacterium]
MATPETARRARRSRPTTGTARATAAERLDTVVGLGHPALQSGAGRAERLDT